MRFLIIDDEAADSAAVAGALRRASLAPRPLYAFAGWLLDVDARNLSNGAGGSVHLTASEFDLLTAFLAAPGRPLSRQALTRALRGRDWRYLDRSLDTLVARLRKKLEGDPSRPPLVRSVRGVGYVFCAAVTRFESARPDAA